MSFFVPEALNIFATAGAALRTLVDWKKEPGAMPGHQRYWQYVRVQNIIKQICLLLKHVQGS